MWPKLRSEAKTLHDSEPFLRAILDDIVLSASSFADSIAKLLAKSFQELL
jgi:hypothetical protein